MNKRIRVNKSIYRGVSWDSETNKWRCNFYHKKKNYSLGRHDDEEYAAENYNKKAEEIMGNEGFRNEIGVGFYKIGKGNNHKWWTREEDATIKHAYENNEEINDLEEKMGRSLQSIRVRASKLGYSEMDVHELNGLRPHRIWRAMKARILNKNGDRYHRYGGRGLKIDDKWLEFEGFWQDMEEGYSDELTIGRIDNDKGYYKNNCRWENREQQDNNTGRTRWITYKGKKQSLTLWAREFGLETKTLDGRISRGWSIEHALTIPVGTTSRYRDKVLNK